MFKECLIDIDFNLLVLSIISLFEVSLLPAPASLSAGCEHGLSAGALRFPLCFSRGAAASSGVWVSALGEQCHPALAAVVTGTATVQQEQLAPGSQPGPLPGSIPRRCRSGGQL